VLGIPIPGGGSSTSSVSSYGGGYVGINFQGDVYTRISPLNWDAETMLKFDMIIPPPLNITTSLSDLLFDMDIKWNLDIMAYLAGDQPSGYISGFHTSYPTFTLSTNSGQIYYNNQNFLLSLVQFSGTNISVFGENVNLYSQGF
jgi:hypothetical protein